MTGFALQRLGMLMEPEPGNPQEVEGVLNPAAVRGPDGQLYLFPRLVARGNYSRIGIARVRFNEAGNPAGVERLGIALEPEADYERRPGGGGGCEDPRITFVEPLKRYVMTYTAFSTQGPRIALASVGVISSTGSAWDSPPLGCIKALTSATWITKMPASSPLPFPIPPGIRNSACSTGRFSLARDRRRQPATPLPVTWISIGRASGFPTAKWPRKTINPITSAASPLITGWQLPCRPGSGSKLAAARRLS